MTTAPQAFDTGLRLADLEQRRPRPVETPWGTMALFLIAGEVLCVQAFCPHLQGPLFYGSVTGCVVTCPWHQWRFDLRTGQRVDLAGLFAPRPAQLERCNVSAGPQGTLVLDYLGLGA